MPSLVIAEKSNQIAEIEAAVGSTYGRVVSASGHILTLKEPKEVDPAFGPWTTALLTPPSGRYPLKPESSKQRYVDAIRSALKGVDTVYIATDPDREGQLIGDEILDFLQFRGRVFRVMRTAVDAATIVKAFNDAKPNSAYRGMYEAAVARQQGDQIYNLTMTRVVTVALRAPAPFGQKMPPPIGIGRVKTPVMGVICKREREILDFKPTDYFEVEMAVTAPTGDCTLAHRPPEKDRILDRDVAKAIAASAKAFAGPVSVKTESKRQGPPLLFDAASAQKAAGQWNWAPDHTLDVLQSLYDVHKLTTYPRSECRYLPDAMVAEAEPLRARLAALPDYAADAPRAATIRKGKDGAYNQKEVDKYSHFAIVPNMSCPTDYAAAIAKLGADEAKLFDLVARTFLAAHGEDMAYDQTRIVADVPLPSRNVKLPFVGNGRVVTSEGWRRILPARDAKGDDEGVLPPYKDGQTVRATDAKAIGRTTKPPNRFTIVSILDPMIEAWKYVDDAAEQEALKRAEGIGRPATRQEIVPGLKAQNLVMTKGTTIYPTDSCMALYDILKSCAPGLVDIGTTARMETRLAEIVEGKVDCDTVIAEIADSARTMTAPIVDAGATTKIDMQTARTSALPARKPPSKGASKPTSKAGSGPASKAPSAPGAARPPAGASKAPAGGAPTPAGRVYSKVSFDDRQQAKDAGLSFDGQRKQWYAAGPAQAASADKANLTRAG